MISNTGISLCRTLSTMPNLHSTGLDVQQMFDLGKTELYAHS